VRLTFASLSLSLQDATQFLQHAKAEASQDEAMFADLERALDRYHGGQRAAWEAGTHPLQHGMAPPPTALDPGAVEFAERIRFSQGLEPLQSLRPSPLLSAAHGSPLRQHEALRPAYSPPPAQAGGATSALDEIESMLGSLRSSMPISPQTAAPGPYLRGFP